MTTTRSNWIALSNRGIVALTGGDARQFLQALITNDVNRVSSSRSIYSALLTPQGKLIYDFFVVEKDDALLLDCNSGLLAGLIRHLGLYKLRANVKIEDHSHDWLVLALPHNSDGSRIIDPRSKGNAFIDPRCSKMGYRAIIPAISSEVELGKSDMEKTDHDVYESMRIALGIPDCENDGVSGKFFALECALDDLDGISFEKGCFIGQEVTTRMKHRNLVRKKLLPISFDGPSLPPGTLIANGDVKVGEVCSSVDGHAIAMLKLDQAKSERLMAGNLPVHVKEL